MENEHLTAEMRKGHLNIKGLIFTFLALLIVGSVITAIVFMSRHPLRIAFMSDRDGDIDIYVMKADGSEVSNITATSFQDGYPGWSSEKRIIAFLSTRESTSASIYGMNIYGERLKALAKDMSIVPTTPAWSPDGRWIAFDGEIDGQTDIHLIDVKTGEIKNLTDHPSSDRFSAWSPDSKKILLVSTRDDPLGSYPCLYVIGIDGNADLLRLSDPDSVSALASWSPDGEKIAFTSDRDGNAEIYVMDSNGEHITRLTDNQKFDGMPLWSPDGSKIAFLGFDEVNDQQNPEIYIMNSDGSDQRNISNHSAQDGYNWEFSWSPDGSKILFTTDRDGNLEIYSMDVDGENQTNLTNNPANDLAPEWID